MTGVHRAASTSRAASPRGPSQGHARSSRRVPTADVVARGRHVLRRGRPGRHLAAATAASTSRRTTSTAGSSARSAARTPGRSPSSTTRARPGRDARPVARRRRPRRGGGGGGRAPGDRRPAERPVRAVGRAGRAAVRRRDRDRWVGADLRRERDVRRRGRASPCSTATATAARTSTSPAGSIRRRCSGTTARSAARSASRPCPAPATDLTGVTGAYPLDIDGDGITDLAVLRVGETELLRGLGDCRFERANEAWGADADARDRRPRSAPPGRAPPPCRRSRSGTTSRSTPNGESTTTCAPTTS